MSSLVGGGTLAEDRNEEDGEAREGETTTVTSQAMAMGLLYCSVFCGVACSGAMWHVAAFMAASSPPPSSAPIDLSSPPSFLPPAAAELATEINQ